MKRLTIFLFLILFAFALQGQKALTYGGKVLTYGGKVLTQPSYCSEAEAVFAAMGTEPSSTRKSLINTLIEGLKDDGIWSKLDVFYVTAAHASNSSLLNWINPGSHDLTVVNLAVGQFTINRGWTGNGTNGYLNTNYNPNTDGINYALDDVSMGIYIRNNVAASTHAEFGCYDGTNYLLFQIKHTTGTKIFNEVNSALFSGGVTNADSRGFYISSRDAANNIDHYRNAGNILNEAIASNSIPNREVYILAYNDAGVATSFSTKQVAAAFAGSKTTQTNVNNFTDRIETFMDAIGAGIIP